MKSKKSIYSLLKLSLIILSVNIAFIPDVSGQKRKSTKSQQKEVMKKMEDRKKETEIAEVKGRKKHKRLQEKPVRKRMKKSRKAARRYDTGKRKPFFKRVFTRKKRRK